MTKIQKRKVSKSEAVKILEELKLQALKERYPSNPYPPKIKYRDTTSQAEVERAGGIYLIVRTFQGFFEWYQEFTNQISRDE